MVLTTGSDGFIDTKASAENDIKALPCSQYCTHGNGVCNLGKSLGTKEKGKGKVDCSSIGHISSHKRGNRRLSYPPHCDVTTLRTHV